MAEKMFGVHPERVAARRPVRTKNDLDEVTRLRRRVAQLERSLTWWKALTKRALKAGKEWRWMYKD